MANDSPVSQGLNLHALGLLDPKQGSGSADGANSKDLLNGLIFEAAGKQASTVTKLTGGLVPNLSELGSVSITQPLDKKESWVDRKVNEGAASLSSAGGVVYRATLGTLAANNTITDHSTITNHAHDITDSFSSLVGAPGSYGNFSYSDASGGIEPPSVPRVNGGHSVDM